MAYSNDGLSPERAFKFMIKLFFNKTRLVARLIVVIEFVQFCTIRPLGILFQASPASYIRTVSQAGKQGEKKGLEVRTGVSPVCKRGCVVIKSVTNI